VRSSRPVGPEEIHGRKRVVRENTGDNWTGKNRPRSGLPNEVVWNEGQESSRYFFNVA
jgi:hypothetical protein